MNTAPRIYKKETRTDYVGDYVAYIYTDGHIETEPPHRPQSKEDAQRARRIEAIRKRAVAVLASERAAQGNGPLPNNVKRENLDTVAGKILLEFYHNILHKIGDVSPTATAYHGSIETLRKQVGLGGQVIGIRAGERPHYDAMDVPRGSRDEKGVRKPATITRI